MLSLSQPDVDLPTTVGGFLDRPLDGDIEPDPHLWGFGGLHGGLALAVLTASMQATAPGAAVRSVTGQFHRPLRRPFRVHATPVRAGRAATTVTAGATVDGGAHVTATATLGPATRSSDRRAITPPAPVVPPPDACEVFSVPLEFVPIAAQTELRPVGPDRPFAGGSTPELTAWVRLVEDDRPPDLGRLVVLVDCLAPSYAAILDAPQLVPTVELSVRPGDGLADASSPWVLLAARTLVADGDGWIDERIDAWGPDGAHLGSAQQLRLVVPM